MVNLRSLSSWLGLGLALGALAPACRHPDAVRPPAPLEAPSPPPSPSTSLAQLRWVLGGSRLLVDNQWLLDPEGGDFTRLPYATSRPVEGGGTELLGVSLSRRDRIAVWDALEFRFGPVGAALEGPFPLPGPPEAPDAPRRARLLFWTAREEPRLYQHPLVAGASASCAVFDPGTRVWTPIGECPEGDFVELTQVEAGPEEWMALLSEGEGGRSFRLTRDPPGARPPEAPALDIDVSFPGALETRFSEDGTRLWLTTPCQLEREERPCRDVEDETPWRLYSWRLGERRLVLEREGLPPHVVASSVGERLAWPLPGRVCIGEGTRLDAARCHALPP
jgi:hypothetical protein